jgi:hypothetical protein
MANSNPPTPPTPPNPLTLLMPVTNGTSVQTLLTLISQNQAAIDTALTNIGTVHFARFLVLDTSSPNLQPTSLTTSSNLVLAVITEYDGSFASYISDFVGQLADVFNALLSYVDLPEGSPPLVPVQNNQTAFQNFVQANDASQNPAAPALYCAYPYTVQTILSDCGSTANAADA